MKFQLSGPPAVLPHSRKKLQSSDVGVASRPPFFSFEPCRQSAESWGGPFGGLSRVGGYFRVLNP